MADLSRRYMMSATAGVLAFPWMTAWTGELLPSAFGNEDSVEKKDATKTLPIRILFNENPLGCSPGARDAVIQSLSQGNFYALEQAGKLVNKLRAKHRMPLLPESRGPSLRPQNDSSDHGLILGGGSSELLLAASHAFSVDGGNVVEPALTYQTVGNTAKTRPGPPMERRQIALKSDGSLDADAMIAACDARTRLLVVTNPNNPTGGAIELQEIQKLVTKAPSHTLVVVDEAYIDFLENHETRTAIPFALRSENVLVTRTFSKIHGLAGLRCGYAIGHKSIFTRMQPFQVGSLSLNLCGVVAAMSALDDISFQNASRAMAADSRKRIAAQLKSLGFRVAKSDAACLWAEWDRETASLVSRLAERGILISSGMRWNALQSIRISIGTEWQTTRLIDELSIAVKQI